MMLLYSMRDRRRTGEAPTADCPCVHSDGSKMASPDGGGCTAPLPPCDEPPTLPPRPPRPGPPAVPDAPAVPLTPPLPAHAASDSAKAVEERLSKARWRSMVVLKGNRDGVTILDQLPDERRH